MYGLPGSKETDRRSASPRMTESSLPICSAIPNRTDRFRASRSNNSDEIRLLLPPDAKSNPASTTSGSENIESTATISAKPSWKAAWSGVERSMYRLRKPSSSACVVSCAARPVTTLAADRHFTRALHLPVLTGRGRIGLHKIKAGGMAAHAFWFGETCDREFVRLAWDC